MKNNKPYAKTAFTHVKEACTKYSSQNTLEAYILTSCGVCSVRERVSVCEREREGMKLFMDPNQECLQL